MTDMLKNVRGVLAATPDVLRALLGGANDEALAFREGADGWDARQILCHVADGEITDWMPRVRMILQGGDRPFVPFNREGGFNRFAGRSVPSLLDEFARLRSANLEALDALKLSESDLQRPGLHPELGPVTLGQLLACWATHDLGHVNQISRLFLRAFGQHIGPWTAFFSLLRT